MLKALFSLGVIGLLSGPAAAQVVNINVGTSLSAVSPINHADPFCVYEGIYLQTQINQSGQITHLAFNKGSGTNLTPFDNVVIYLKTTPATSFTAGSVDSTDYQRVFKGSFTNATASGFQEVRLSRPFTYNNTQNLSVLVIRTNGTTVTVNAERARWLYGFTTGRNSSRRADGAVFPNSLTVSTVLPNLRLTFGTATAGRKQREVLTPLYPNPATDYIRLAADQPAAVRVTDLTGRELLRTAALRPQAGQITVLVGELPAGVYLVHQTAADGTTVSQRFARK